MIFEVPGLPGSAFFRIFCETVLRGVFFSTFLWLQAPTWWPMATQMVSFRVPLGIKSEQNRAPLAAWASRPAPGCPKSHFWVPLEGFGGYSGRIFWHILGHCWDKFSDFFLCVWLGRGRGRAEGAGEDHWN